MPAAPGVYLMRDSRGNILYVGKSASLRNRVRSYFGARQKLTPKLQEMVAQVNDFEFFVTSSEQEALILELNLIKRHQPRYNVMLRDDKTFPYLMISTNEDWPRIQITRRLEENGGRYFGPFASAWSIRHTLKLLKGLFPLRSCTKRITGTEPRPCLNYHIGHCLAPCTGSVTRREYDDIIRQVTLFLEGRHEKIIRQLKKKMEKAAEALNFEGAAMLRDQIQALDNVIEAQRIATTVKGDQDVIAFATNRDQACVQVFFIRSGKLIGRESFVLRGTYSEEPQQIMTSFVKQFYSANPNIPPLLLLQHPLEDMELIREWLKSKRNGKVSVQVPRRGNRKQLVDIVAENARQGLEQLRIKELSAPSVLSDALKEIEKELNLPRLPSRIETYDISNIQGKDAVGSMVVFEDGKPKPAHYRRFKIKTVEGADDCAMLKEVLNRRFKKLSDASSEDTWALLPDLVLIDGGKGQLNAATEAMRETGATSVPVASLAKENEEIFIPGRASAIALSRSSPALQLLQRSRDEAHRFALGYYQRVHKKRAFTSAMDGIPGIGDKRKRALMKRFGSVKAIRDAPVEELVTVKGISESLARKIKEYL